MSKPKLGFKVYITVILLVISNTTSLFCQEKNDYGFLKIHSDFDSLQILIDGKHRETTAFSLFRLKPGTYNVIAINPGRYLWGHLDWQREITIFPFDTLTINPEFKNIFSIRSQPFGADVFIDNELKGTTPLTMLFPQPIMSEILLKKKGYKSQTIKLTEQITFLNVNLEKDEAVYNQQNFLSLLNKKKKSYYRKATVGFWTISLVTGLSSIYFKNLADENYDKYLAAGSIKSMNHYYDTAIKNDNYTNICLGVFQGCCMLSFYFLMKSFD